MMKLNNKGQTLVMFIVIIPILISIMVLVIDLGSAFTKKQELNNVNKLVIEYGLDNLDQENLESDLTSYITMNAKDLSNVKVTVENNTINVTTKAYIDGIISKALNIDGFEIVSTYQGYLSGEEKELRGWNKWHIKEKSLVSHQSKAV